MDLRPGAPSDWAAALTSFSFQPLNPDLSEPNVFRLLMHLLSDIGLREVPDFDWLADADSMLCIRCFKCANAHHDRLEHAERRVVRIRHAPEGRVRAFLHSRWAQLIDVVR